MREGPACCRRVVPGGGRPPCTGFLLEDEGKNILLLPSIFRGRCFFLYKIIINLNEIRKKYLEDAEKRNRGVPFFGPSASAAWVIKWAFRYAMKAFFKETPHQDACEESAHPHLRAAFFQGPVMASGCFFRLRYRK